MFMFLHLYFATTTGTDCMKLTIKSNEIKKTQVQHWRLLFVRSLNLLFFGSETVVVVVVFVM